MGVGSRKRYFHKAHTCRSLSHVIARNPRRKSSGGHGLKNTWSGAWNVVEWREEVRSSCPRLSAGMKSWAQALAGTGVLCRNPGSRVLSRGWWEFWRWESGAGRCSEALGGDVAGGKENGGISVPFSLLSLSWSCIFITYSEAKN